MPKVGRNDPCPCGSGRKYKRCCMEKEQAAERAALDAARTAAAVAEREQRAVTLEEDDHLANASNAVIDLLDAGAINEAEQAARELLVRFPEVHDGYDRLGMVYEARGDHKRAADCYRKVIEFVRGHPDQYDPEFEHTFQRLIAKLDPPPATD